ncbi:MAG: hypothetical protein EHM13_11235, partial [Acidobacteria bacterium]
MTDGMAMPSSLLAFVTTIHAALVILRLHRGRMPGVLLLALPSTAFAAMTWALPGAGGIAAGLVMHLVWFLVCERLVPWSASVPTRNVPGAAAARVETQPAGSTSAAQARHPVAAFVQVPVLAVLEETPRVRTFRMARPSDFKFKAGQFLAVRVQADGRPLTRCYSVSSAPESGYLEISVRRQGVVSNLLHSTIRPGGMLHIRRPAGPFVYPEADDRPLVLVAGGIGITPLLSMIRHAVAADPLRPVTLIYSVRSHSDLAFADELSLISRRHRQAHIVVTVTNDASVDLYRRGRVDAAL